MRLCGKGTRLCPSGQQGLKILRVLVGQPEFVQSFFERKSEEQSTLFERIPAVADPQAAWLLFLMCASTRADCPEPCQSGVAPEMARRVGLQRGQVFRVVPPRQAINLKTKTLKTLKTYTWTPQKGTLNHET